MELKSITDKLFRTGAAVESLVFCVPLALPVLLMVFGLHSSTVQPLGRRFAEKGAQWDTHPRGNAHGLLKIFSRILLKSATSCDMVYKRFNNESGSLAI